MTTRYHQLLKAVREKQPRTILEVGTWNGERARQMLNLCPDATYYGFDLFEDATPETDQRELNVKHHHSIDYVYAFLDGYTVQLFKGDTRETLARMCPPNIEFVWLDGGHSVETIRSDWDAIKPKLAPNAWVFFDDYYTGPIDTTKYGCNEIVRELKHDVMSACDLVKNGGFVQMVRVYP